MPKLLDAIADHYLSPQDGAVRHRPPTGREAAAQGGGLETVLEVKEEGRQPTRRTLRHTLRALGLI